MSTRAKGNMLERRVEHYRQREGYETHRAQQAAFFVGPGKVRSRRVDLWGIFDVAGIPMRCPPSPPHENLFPSCFAFVFDQVTVSNGAKAAERRRKIERFFASDFRRELLARGAVRAFVWRWGHWKKAGWGFQRFELGTTGTEWAETFIPSKDAPLPRNGAS